jgi:hypothetical protein
MNNEIKTDPGYKMRKKLWLVVRYAGDENKDEGGIRIKEDDTIRVGRITFKIRELVYP